MGAGSAPRGSAPPGSMRDARLPKEMVLLRTFSDPLGRCAVKCPTERARMVPKSACIFSAWPVMAKHSAMADAAGAALQGGRNACVLQSCAKILHAAALFLAFSIYFLGMPSSSQLEFVLISISCCRKTQGNSAKGAQEARPAAQPRRG